MPFTSSASAQRISASLTWSHVADMGLLRNMVRYSCRCFVLYPKLNSQDLPQQVCLWSHGFTPRRKNLQLGRTALGEDPCYPQWIHLEAWHFSSKLFPAYSLLGFCVSETIQQTGNLKRGIKRCTQDFREYQASIKNCRTKWLPMPSSFQSNVCYSIKKGHLPPQSKKRKLLVVSWN